MSFKFGKNSEKQLATVKPELQKVARRALELSPYDFTIVQGSHGQRSLAGYSPWGHKESDMTEGLSRYPCIVR